MMTKQRLLSLVLAALMLVGAIPFAAPVLAENQDTVITCGQPEHAHSDACRLSCAEAEAHTHGSACYQPLTRLDCAQEHEHGEACFVAVGETLSCTLQEGHTHTEVCYAAEDLCGLKEHSHSADCYAVACVECSALLGHTADCSLNPDPVEPEPEATAEPTAAPEVTPAPAPSAYDQLAAAETADAMRITLLALMDEDMPGLEALSAAQIAALISLVNTLPGSSSARDEIVESLGYLPNGGEDNEAVGYKAYDANYIYFDLYCGDVVINDSTYSGWRFDANGQSVRISGTHSAGNQYYVYQSTPSNLAFNSIPEYDRIMNGQWGDYITGRNDVLDVINKWNAEAANVGRSASPAIGTKYNIQNEAVPQPHRIDVVTNVANSKFNITIDNIWSGYQNDYHRKPNGELYYGVDKDDKVGVDSAIVRRTSGGISFVTNNETSQLHVNLKGDSRFGNIHYNVKDPIHDALVVNDIKNQLFFYDASDTGIPGTVTVANLRGDTGENKFCSVIGGSNQQNYVAGICIESGVIYAGATARDNCTAIGAGGCGFGGVTINGGKVTAVTSTNGTAIGGGIGDGANGGAANVLISGGTVYAYNNGLAIYSTRTGGYNSLDMLEAIVPAVAIGSGSSRTNKTSSAKVTITGGHVVAQSVGGTAIGGGSSNNCDAADAEIYISGNAYVSAKSIAGNVPLIREPDASFPSGQPPIYYNGGDVATYEQAKKLYVSASTSIGGGTAGTPFWYELVNGNWQIVPQGDGGNCSLTISGNPTIIAGSIGGGGTNDLTGTGLTPGIIGSAKVDISGGNISGQVIMEAGSEDPCSFNMTGGVIDNAAHDPSYVFLQENGGAVYVGGGNATLSGGTIKNCDDGKIGGAFYVSGGSVDMSGGLIENTESELGGAIYVNNGSVTMSGGTIQECNASMGGAAYVSNGNFTMTSGTLQKNGTIPTTTHGGAVYVLGGNVSVGIQGCTQDNPVDAHKDGSPQHHPIVRENEASFGGALTVNGGRLILYCCDILNNTSDNAGTGMNIFVQNGTFQQYIDGTDIGHEDEGTGKADHGIVMVGGNMDIMGSDDVELITINYHANGEQYQLTIVWSPQAPDDYWLNLPYCPTAWSDHMAQYDLVFVGWGDHMGGSEAHSIRSTADYRPIGMPIQVYDLKKNSEDNKVDLYAIWAPERNEIKYAYAKGAKQDEALSRKFYGEITNDVATNHPMFNGQTVPDHYEFTDTTTAVNVPDPTMPGYRFVKWIMYASPDKISNWNADAYKVQLVNGNYIAVLDDQGYPILDDKAATRLEALYNKDTGLVDRYEWKDMVQQNFGDIVLVAVFEEVEVQINYQVVGPEGKENAATLAPTSEKVLADTGSLKGSTATAAPGMKIVGWFTDAACQNPVEAADQVLDSSATNGKYATEATIFPNGKLAEDVWENNTTFYVKVEYAVADLLLKTENCVADHSYLFTISGKPADSSIAFTPITVAMHGNMQRYIRDLPVGEYTVTEQHGWSWRYTVDGDTAHAEVVDGTESPHTVSFDGYASVNTRWLDDNAYTAQKLNG